MNAALSDQNLLNACQALLTRLGRARALGLGSDLNDMEPLLQSIWPRPEDQALARAALGDPYLAHTMLWRTLVLGFRGNPRHLRPLDRGGAVLAADLLSLLKNHLRIRRELGGLVDWPQGGLAAGDLAGDGGWCDLCGECCCHNGTVPSPPSGVDYPPFYYHLLAGAGVLPQPYCPFLFQAKDRPVFFCALHPVKPLACSSFGAGDCRRGRPGRGYRT